MDLEMLFPSINSLRTASWKKWTKLFTVLLALVLAYLVFILTVFTYNPLHISFVFYFASISLLHHLARIITITSLHFNFITRSNLITSPKSITPNTLMTSLHHYRISPISEVTTYLRISIFFSSSSTSAST